MGHTFTNKKAGIEWHVKVSDAEFLNSLFFGLFEKIGHTPRSVEDCKIMARIMKNRCSLNKYYRPYWPELYNEQKLSLGDIEWLLEGASFFEKIEDFHDLERT